MHNILHAYTMPPDDTLTRDIRKEHQIQKHYFDQNHHTTKPSILKKIGSGNPGSPYQGIEQKGNNNF